MQLRLSAGLLMLSLLGSCGSQDPPEVKTLEGSSVTLWTDKTELFMEYPALAVGREARFAAHLTRLSDFKPFVDEVVHFHFRSNDGVNVEQEIENPSPAGIYRPSITFRSSGTYDLMVVVKGGFVDTLKVEGIQVFASLEDHVSAQESGPPEQLITFLKEQQWKTDFRTERVRRELISGSIHAAGEIIPKLNSEAIVAAPFTGYVPAERSSQLPVPGASVGKGARLALMLPSAETPGGSEDFTSRYTDAETERDLASKEYERAKRLFAIQGISERELQEAEAHFRRADATFKALGGYLHAEADSPANISHRGFVIRSPITGKVAEVHAVPGKHVSAGEPLFRVIEAATVWVRVSVPVTEIGKVNKPGKAWMQLSGIVEPYEINRKNGRLISIGTAVDEETRTVPVIFEVRNQDEMLRIGMIGEVYIASGEEHGGLVVPESALIEEEGQYTVYVHVEGEAFAKREVQLGDSESGRVEILSGVQEGERVVTVGAYQVRLASLSSRLPAHGHEH